MTGPGFLILVSGIAIILCAFGFVFAWRNDDNVFGSVGAISAILFVIALVGLVTGIGSHAATLPGWPTEVKR